MSRWGTVVTGFYVVIVAGLLASLAKPEAWALLSVSDTQDVQLWSFIGAWFGLLFLGPLVLAFVRVDPYFGDKRSPVWLCLIAILLPTIFLLIAGAGSLAMALDVWHRRGGGPFPDWVVWLPFVVALAWLVWSFVLFKKSLALTDRKSTLYRWLVKGSVLELLIAVPSHVYVSRRGECTDPIVTGFGMATGAALLIASLGPGVFFLYRERVRMKRTMQEQRAAAIEPQT